MRAPRTLGAVMRAPRKLGAVMRAPGQLPENPISRLVCNSAALTALACGGQTARTHSCAACPAGQALREQAKSLAVSDTARAAVAFDRHRR